MDWDSVFGREAYFVFLALVLAFGMLQTAGTVMGTEQPVVSVVSCSMYPEYDRGDILFVNGVEFSSIEEGDVVVFNAPMKSTVSVDGAEYRLSEQPTDTSIGEGRVLKVEDNTAVLEFDGERSRVESGRSYSIKDSRVEVENVSGVNMPVVHRVADKRNSSLETKGDNNPRQLDFEKDIRPEHVYGKVLFRLPKIGALKLVAMDFVGLTGQPLRIDSYTGCR
ncbi:MAG: signal peptidase I [Candidatus Nanohaloarchaea archaeon]